MLRSLSKRTLLALLWMAGSSGIEGFVPTTTSRSSCSHAHSLSRLFYTSAQGAGTSISSLADRDLYCILGLSECTADMEQIKAAYRSLARQYHPDANPDGDTAEMFVAINTAYHILKDPEQRKEYDTVYHILKDPEERKERVASFWEKQYSFENIDYSCSCWGDQGEEKRPLCWPNCFTF